MVHYERVPVGMPVLEADVVNGLADFANLTDVALRRSLEAEHGLFIAEGGKVIARAIASGYQPRAALASERWAPQISKLLQDFDIPLFVAAEDQLRAITGFNVHRGALASMQRRQLPSMADVLSTARRVIVMEAIVEHTNVGAMFRSAAALGVDAILLDPRCADPLYRRAVKVSMGAVFSLPWTRVADWPQGLKHLRQRGFGIWALTPDAAALTLDEAVARHPDGGCLALLFGTEGAGLSDATRRAADAEVRIPMANGIDSLNAAAAMAVACWATRDISKG